MFIQGRLQAHLNGETGELAKAQGEDKERARTRQRRI
jgi:hypothetical protein